MESEWTAGWDTYHMGSCWEAGGLHVPNPLMARMLADAGPGIWRVVSNLTVPAPPGQYALCWELRDPSIHPDGPYIKTQFVFFDGLNRRFPYGIPVYGP